MDECQAFPNVADLPKLLQEVKKITQQHFKHCMTQFLCLRSMTRISTEANRLYKMVLMGEVQDENKRIRETNLTFVEKKLFARPFGKCFVE